MATTITAGFSKLSENLEITGLQSATTSTRQKAVREAVEKDFTVLDSFLAGSYARSTMIGPLKDCDIDIMVVLDPSYFQKYKPAALLDRTRTVLLKTYTSTPKISRNGQAVTITFTDFQVDVVPSFYRTGGGFLIPNSLTGEWIATNPTVHADKLTAANKAHNGQLVPIIKMIKSWNRNISNAFVGFYLELMIIDILTNVKISDFPSGIRYVLDKGREKIKFKQTDPAGFGGQVPGLQGVSTVKDAISRFETAYGRAVKAEEFAARGNLSAATDEWRKIFGNYFPAFG
jgi:Second Messenger Oligonucleotide or Dinucleotide Synthetase domain